MGLLEQLGAEIKFESGKNEFKVKDDQLIDILSLALVSVPAQTGVPKGIKNQVYPRVWATEMPRRAQTTTPYSN